MLDFLATLWCLIGIIVGVLVLFLVIVGVGEILNEAVKQHGVKYGRK